MNQADKASIFKRSGPKRSVPEKFNTKAGPVSAPTAIKVLTDAIMAMVDKAIIPFTFELKKSIEISAAKTIISRILINATGLI
jgi:hypothetical protein